MIEAYQNFLLNYTNFNGCTSRKDYWYVVLFNLIISIIIGLLTAITGVYQLYNLTYIYELATLIPSIAISVRRLHDINKSGLYYLLILIPIVGAIILIIFMCLDRIEPNKYGEKI